MALDRPFIVLQDRMGPKQLAHPIAWSLDTTDDEVGQRSSDHFMVAQAKQKSTYYGKKYCFPFFREMPYTRMHGFL